MAKPDSPKNDIAPIKDIELVPHEENYEIIRKHYKRALEQKISKTWMITTRSDTQNWIHGIPRVFIMLEGKRMVEYYSHGQQKISVMQKGDSYFSSREGFAYTPYENHTSKHVSLSLVYLGNMVRFVVNESAIKEDSTPVLYTWYYHTSSALPPAGEHLIEALTLHGEKKQESDTGKHLLQALLQISGETFSNQQPGHHEFDQTYRLWDDMNNHLARNRHTSLSREEIAQKFSVSPGHVSRLFRRFSGKSFVQAQNEYRLVLAREYLLDTGKTIKEIAAMCGYENVAYFTKIFRERYNIPPGKLRKTQNKNQIEGI